MKLFKSLSERVEFWILVLFGIVVSLGITFSIVYGLVPLIKSWDGTAGHDVSERSNFYGDMQYVKQSRPSLPPSLVYRDGSVDSDLDNSMHIAMLTRRLFREMRQAQDEGVSNEEFIDNKIEFLESEDGRLKELLRGLDTAETLLLERLHSEKRRLCNNSNDC